MRTAKWISLIFLILSVGEISLGAQFSTSTQKISKRKDPLKGLSLVLPSVVVHGTRPEVAASVVMPRKIDGNGNVVITPGAGLQYVGDGGLLLLGAIVKDCYDNLAGTFQIGEVFEISDRTNWGVSLGVYARQTPMACTTTTDGRTRTTDCYNLDSYRLKFSASINGDPVDIIPMPFLHFTTALYKDRDFRIDFKVMSNIVLNEFGISVPF